MSRTNGKPPHPSRLSALDLALLNGANATVEAATLALRCKMLEARVRELEYTDAVRVLRDQTHAAEMGKRLAEGQYKELAERLARDYAIDLKRSVIVPETGDIQTNP